MNNEVCSNLAARLIAIRKRLGVTQQTLAEMLGIDKNYVYMLEKGRRAGKKVIARVSQLETEESHQAAPAAAIKNPDHFEMTAVAAALPAELAAGGLDEYKVCLEEIEKRLRHFRGMDRANRRRLKAAILNRIDEYDAYCETHCADLRKAIQDDAARLVAARKAAAAHSSATGKKDAGP